MMRVYLIIFLAVTALQVTAGCHRSVSNRPADEAVSITQVRGKFSAPVEVNLTHVMEGKKLRIIMEMTATADIPRGVARFAVPEGIVLLEGEETVDLGTLKKGEIRTCEIVVDGTARNYRLHGGVDAVFSDSMRLNSGSSLVVGTVPEANALTKVIKVPGAQDGIRVEEVTPD